MQSFPKTAREILRASLGTKEAARHDIPEEKILGTYVEQTESSKIEQIYLRINKVA